MLRRVPFVVPPGTTLAVTGSPVIAASFLRAVRVAAEAVAAADPVRSGPAAEVEVRLDAPAAAVVLRGPAALRGRRFRPSLVTAASAAALLPRAEDVPSIAALTAEPAPDVGLTARFALEHGRPVQVDLVADGPHAIVAGTTGSGKSALLTAWVLALAAAHPPERLVLLLVDHKGGAAFDPVAHLPQVAGIVTDLDGAGTDRAVQSLAAELRRREQVLRDAAVADIAGTAEPRLVVVVDEFRALLEARPALAAVFTDVAARGRSLGVHLVLCTQRPAGSIRDELADELRAAHRAARARRRRQRRRRRHSGGRRAAEGARRRGAGRRGSASPADHGRPGRPRRDRRSPRSTHGPAVPPAARGSTRSRTGCPSRRSPRVPGRLVLGLVDAPDEQAQPPLAWRPSGGLLVAGRPGSGRTTALVLAAGLLGAVDPAGDAAAAWDAVHDDDVPVVLDDLEALLDGLGAAPAAALLERLAQRLRRPGAAPVVLAVRGPAGVGRPAPPVGDRALHRAAAARARSRRPPRARR